MADSVKEAILKTCFSKVDTTFAGGKRANNKLDLELILDNPTLRKRVGRSIAHLAQTYNPDLVVGVPDGANWLAGDIANYLGINQISLNKDPETKSISFASDKDALLCAGALRVLVAEDVFNEYTSTRKVLAIPQIGKRAVAAIGIWDRGLEAERQPIVIETKSLVSFHIPSQLPGDSGLWEYVD